jgi:hypothetical protein
MASALCSTSTDSVRFDQLKLPIQWVGSYWALTANLALHFTNMGRIIPVSAFLIRLAATATASPVADLRASQRWRYTARPS